MQANNINGELCNFDKKEISFTYGEWFRLRELWINVQSYRNSLHTNVNQLDKYISEESTYRTSASDVQNLTIHLKILERKSNLTREKIRNIRYRLNSIEIENEKVRHDIAAQLDLNSIQNEMENQEGQIIKNRTTMRKSCNELKFRRRFMLKNLYEIYFSPKTTNSIRPIYQKKCVCLKFDLLRGLHLPTVAARLGHNDAELSAATGHLVHLLDCMSRILSYPLKHPVIFKGSHSFLITRINKESHNLFNSTSSKNNRDRFDHALYLLCESVVQLRADCGIGSRELDRPIRLLRELLLSFIGEQKFTQDDLVFKFGKSSYLSPSVYITIDNEIAIPKKSSEPILYNLLTLLPTF